MAEIKVNFNNITGPVKAMHSVGQPPFLGANMGTLHYLTDANIPHSRLHDVGGMFGAGIYVDIPNIFRDFNADVNDPESYDFAFTDHLISHLIKNKVEPIYRLGVTIENYTHIKRYRIFPPADFHKWAKICEMIIRHYNQGWANGFEYGIKYWEIWNEPDGNFNEPEKSGTWYGSDKQFYDLYTISAKHLKKCFGNSILIGGYASCGFYTVVADPENYGINIPNYTKNNNDPAFSKQYRGFVSFFENFLKHIRENDAPLDFFTWHSYAPVSHNLIMQKYVEETLAKNGYSDIEIHLNEWNNAYERHFRGTSFAASAAVAMMIAMHSTKMNIMCYYDARIGTSMFGGMFDANTLEPVSTYYAFKAFGELYALGNCVECTYDGVYALAAVSEDGSKKAVLITNTKEDTIAETNLEGLKAYLIEKDVFLEERPLDIKNIELKKNQTILLKNY